MSELRDRQIAREMEHYGRVVSAPPHDLSSARSFRQGTTPKTFGMSFDAEPRRRVSTHSGHTPSNPKHDGRSSDLFRGSVS
jgi:hypothetical protein